MQTGNSKGSTLVIMLLGVAFWMSAAQLNGAYSTTNNDDNVVTGDVINSKYLAITYHKYVNQKDSDIITGTIVNNSTKDISSVRIYAALYDKDNKLITTEGGVVNVPALTPTLTSPFTISLVNTPKPDHYTLLPGGTPS
ncbi:MAG: FxLYD domain-containing protein [Nitrososphaeraceae archaeon]